MDGDGFRAGIAEFVHGAGKGTEVHDGLDVIVHIGDIVVIFRDNIEAAKAVDILPVYLDVLVAIPARVLMPDSDGMAKSVSCIATA